MLNFREKLAKQLINKGYIKIAEINSVDGLIEEYSSETLGKDSRIAFDTMIEKIKNNEELPKESILNELIKKVFDDGFGSFTVGEDVLETLSKYPKLLNIYLNYLYKSGFIYDYLKAKYISYDKDPEFFKKCVNEFIKNQPASAGWLLRYNIVNKKQDPEFYNDILNKVIDKSKSFYFLTQGKLTKQDGDLFWKAIDNMIKNDENSDTPYLLLKNHIITREDGKVFEDIVKKLIDMKKEKLLLRSGLVTIEEIEDIKIK